MKKILIADDEPDILFLAQSALEAEGYQIIIAKNGQEALDMAQRELPDLLILDGLMPKLHGFEVSKQVKALGPGLGTAYNPKVVIMTAVYKSEVYKIEAWKDFKVDDYIYKPFDVDDLVKRVKKQLGD